MISTLRHLLRLGTATPREMFPDLQPHARGLPRVTETPCAAGQGCTACVEACPTKAIAIAPHPVGGAPDGGGRVTLDLGLCIACGGCVQDCRTGTIVEDRSTAVAVRAREQLVQSNLRSTGLAGPPPQGALFSRSIHLRAISTGDNASDLEVAAANNPIFDASRFGVHFVASPRFADALIVTGPVGRAMREPLRRCWDAMAEPRLAIACGASAISGGLHRGGYAGANGVDAILPVDVYIPGHPPHPWYILHGILLAMGHPILLEKPRRS